MTIYKPMFKKVIYLNTEVGCTKIATGGKNLSYTWYLNSIKIDDIADLKLSNFVSQGTGDGNNILMFRIENLNFNSRNYFSSDNISAPLILTTSLAKTPNYELDLITLTLEPQIINCIKIIPSDTLDNSFAGVADTLKFIFCLVIEEYDLKLTKIGDPYGEARMNSLNNKLY